MNRFRALLTATLLVSACGLAFPQTAAAQGAGEMPQKKAIEEIVHDYILNNPEVVIEALTRYEQKMQDDRNAQVEQKIKEFHKEIFENPAHPVVGNPQGDVTLVEFFDYNCGYCKKALPAILEIMDKDKNVRILMMDYPILDKSSEEAARWALAAARQGKYFEFHKALMEDRAPKTESEFARIAGELKLDVEKMRADAKSEDVTKILNANRDLGQKIGINSTPTFIVGDKLHVGFSDATTFLDSIKAARDAKSGKAPEKTEDAPKKK